MNRIMTAERRVVVVGLGGIGSWLADAFARVLNVNAPGSQLVLVDGDTFEHKNAERQNFTHLGNKAKSVAGDLIEKVDNTFIIPMAAWVVSEELAEAADADEEGVSYISAENLLREDDIVFVCVDNAKARKLLFDAAAKLNNIDVFNGGNEEDGFGCTYYYCRRDGVDVTDHPAVHHDEFINPPDKNPGELSCAERAQLESGTQLIATNLMVASVMCHDAQQAIFADAASENPEGEYHRTGVLLSNEKMWNVDISGFNAWSRMDQAEIDRLCDINDDVAEQVHGKVMVLETT